MNAGAGAGAENPLVAPDRADFGVKFGKHEGMRERGTALFQCDLLARGRR